MWDLATHATVAADAVLAVLTRPVTPRAITTVRPHPVQRPRYPGGPVDTVPAPVLTGAPYSGAARIAGIGGLLAATVAGGLAYATTLWLGLTVGVVVAAAGCWQALRRGAHIARVWAGGHRVLTHHDDRDAVRRALAAAIHTVQIWPALAAAVGLEDPSPTLAGSLWDLAGILAERGTARDTRTQLVHAMRGVPTDNPVHAEMTTRLTQIDAVLQRLDTDATRRLGHVTALSAETDQFVGQQQALTQARAVLRTTDQVLGALSTAPQPAEDAAADLAERTTAVLTAYRELTNHIAR